VAIAHERAYATAADGRPLDVGHAMVALYVFLKEGDRWWVAARPNTLVPVGS
jgi:ketosteroid isomerase-like protein